MNSLKIESFKIRSLLPVKFATDNCAKDKWINIEYALYDGMYVLQHNFDVAIFEFYCMCFRTNHFVVAERDKFVSLCFHTQKNKTLKTCYEMNS